MHADSDHVSAIEPIQQFMEDGWIREILYEVKSGKEATVFCCRGGPASPVPLIAANIELMLDHDCVHGDLSPHNVMVHEDRAVIIDFPQAVDPRLNHHGAALLARDIDNVCRWAGRHGVDRPAGRITSRLWGRFVSGELG